MNATDAAQLLGVSRSTLQRLIKEGVLTPVEQPNPLLKRRPRVHFRRDDVVRLATYPPIEPTSHTIHEG